MSLYPLYLLLVDTAILAAAVAVLAETSTVSIVSIGLTDGNATYDTTTVTTTSMRVSDL